MEVDISDKVSYFLKYGLLGLILIAVLSAAGVWYYQHSHAYMTIRDAQVTSTLVGAKVRANGTVTEILVEDGAHVDAGQVIARVKVNVTPDQIHQLEQTVELSKRNLAEVQAGTTVTQPIYSGASGPSQAEIDQAASHLERMEELYAMGAISAVKRDEAAAAYEAARSFGSAGSVSYQTIVQPSSPQVIRNAELQVKQAEAALESAKRESTATEITAPVTGTAYLTEVKADSEVRAGQTILNIGDAGNVWLEAYISKEQQDKVHLGQFVSYTIQNKEYQGSIVDIQEPADSNDAAGNTEGNIPGSPHANKVTLKISLPTQPDSSMRPGQQAVVKVSI